MSSTRLHPMLLFDLHLRRSAPRLSAHWLGALAAAYLRGGFLDSEERG